MQGNPVWAKNRAMARPSRAILHAARLVDAVLFWPALGFVLWGQLQPEPPPLFPGVNDKFLHLAAYFVLGAMAGGAVRQRGAVIGAVAGLILVGAAVELVQAFVGRESSLLDGLANAAGAMAGAALARLVLDPLRRRLGYEK